MLTNEDHLIFRARMSVKAQAALHKADRNASHTMGLANRKMLCPCGAVLSAVTFTCCLGKHCPVH